MTQIGTPTPSLRRRATLAVVGVIALLLMALGIAIDVVFGARLTDDLHDDLADRVSQVPSLLEAGLRPSELVDTLQGQEFRVQIVGPDGRVYGDAQLAPASQASPPISQPAPADDDDPWPPPPWEELPGLTVTRVLPDGSLLTITADTRQVSHARTGLRREMLVGAIGTLVLAAVAVRFVAGRALAPLHHLTATADGITLGHRGRRIHPDQPQTELGTPPRLSTGCSMHWSPPSSAPETRPKPRAEPNNKAESFFPTPPMSCELRSQASKLSPTS